MAIRKKPYTPFGMEVNIYCIQNNITLKQLAEMADVPYISLIEACTGKRSGKAKTIPSVNKIIHPRKNKALAACSSK